VDSLQGGVRAQGPTVRGNVACPLAVSDASPPTFTIPFGHIAEGNSRSVPMSKTKVPGWIYGLLLILAIVVLWRIVGPRNAVAAHPEPRAGITADKLVSAQRYASDQRIARVYAMAARIPNVLDGLYCHCECSKHAGHRSLLTCFESDHGAMCDVCLGEAEIAFRMSQEGKSLDEIRSAIDARFS
jgi:hypothetical protein